MIDKNKSGTFTVIWRDTSRDGDAKDKRRFKTFAKYGDAASFERKLKSEMAEGIYSPPSDHTVKDMAALFLEAARRRWKVQTYNAEKRHVDLYILPHLGHRKMTELRFAEIESAGEAWKSKIDAVTINKIYGTLNAVYKFAAKYEVKVNPMTNVERMASSTTLEQIEAAAGAIIDAGEEPKGVDGALRTIGADEVFTELELGKLIEASQPGMERVKHMTEVLTGLRHGELNALRWQVVDLKKGRIFVNRSLTELKGGAVLERPKTKAAYRFINLPAELISELRKWKLACPPSAHGFVFCDALGRPANRKPNNKALAAAMKRAEIRVLSMNNLRHSFASQHLIAGTALLEVSKLMGHSTPGVTLAVYARWGDRQESHSENVLASRILRADRSEAVAND